MLPDRVSNPGPLTYESGALPIALRGPVLLYRSETPGTPGEYVYDHSSNTYNNKCKEVKKGQ